MSFNQGNTGYKLNQKSDLTVHEKCEAKLNSFLRYLLSNVHKNTRNGEKYVKHMLISKHFKDNMSQITLSLKKPLFKKLP